MDFYHRSVLLEETIQYLNVKEDGIYFDGTLGGAGHSSEILKRLDNGMLVAVDKDQDALDYSIKKLKSIGENFVIAKLDFKDIDLLLDSLLIKKIDGAVIDLGVSSYQLDQADRGFSFLKEAKLDMRMDKAQSVDAHFVVNHYTLEQLTEIIKDYGQEKFAHRVAKKIVESRPIDTTLQLAELVKSVVPFSKKETKHPATRTFQAIRIEVNQELKNLDKAIRKLVDRMNPGARLCIITFHSLEDNIVKKTFMDLESDCECPPELPVCVCNKKSKVKRVIKKAIKATDKELVENPRSRSAQLRVVEVL